MCCLHDGFFLHHFVYCTACWIWAMAHFMVYPNKFLAYNVTNTHPPAPTHTHTHTSHTRADIYYMNRFYYKKKNTILPRTRVCENMYHICGAALPLSFPILAGRPHIGYISYFALDNIDIRYILGWIHIKDFLCLTKYMYWLGLKRLFFRYGWYDMERRKLIAGTFSIWVPNRNRGFDDNIICISIVSL